MASQNRGKGRGIKLVMAATSHQSDECLLWPMGKDRHGYGTFGYLGRIHYAHRYVCEQIYGPAESELHYATHSCGNGHNGCYNPRHLSWKTASENQREMVVHGRQKKKGGTRRKLTQEQVDEIKALKGQMTQLALAEKFGVRAETIGLIHRGELWTGEPSREGRVIPQSVRDRLVPRAKALRAAGLTFKEIGKQLDVSRVTARTYAES